MYFPMHVFIVVMNLGVVTSVVNGWAWDKATTQFLPLCRSYLTLVLTIHNRLGFNQG
jgi:hypothetical protein